MASYRKEDIVVGLQKAFPTTVCTVKITKCEKTRSQNGNDMVRTKVEIVDPTQVETGGTNVVIGGESATLYAMCDPANTYNGIGNMISALTKAGLEPRVVQELPDDEIFSDDNTLLKKFEGKLLLMTVSCKGKTVMRNPTPEEAAAGVKAQPLLDAAGKEIVNGYMVDAGWNQVLGPGVEPQTF